MTRRIKNHRMGTCPTCRHLVKVTEDGRCYRHIGKRNYMEPEMRPCLGTNRIADDIMDGSPEEFEQLLMKGKH